MKSKSAFRPDQGLSSEPVRLTPPDWTPPQMAGFLFEGRRTLFLSEKRHEDFRRQTTFEVIDVPIKLSHTSPRCEQQEVRHDAP
jgi:hypothetical protein